MKLLLQVLCLVGLLLSTSCASVITGRTKKIPVVGPKNYEVWVNGELRGLTPTTLELRRGQIHYVEVYDPKTKASLKIETRRTYNWWSTLNVFTYGIGFIPDLINGSVYNIKPDMISMDDQTSSSFGPRKWAEHQ